MRRRSDGGQFATTSALPVGGTVVENFAVIRHIAVNLIKSARSGHKKTDSLGAYNKRLLAAWDDAYLLRVLGIPS